MSVRIVCVSGSDYERSDRDGLVVLPLGITFGDVTYEDGVDLSHERFYEMLVESDDLPMTSQVTPYAFGQAFREAVGAGDDVVAITLSAELSGTYESAVSAASAFGGRVRVVDSRTASAAEHILVDLALRLADEGKSVVEIADELERRKGDAHVVALLDTLEYLRRGGRVSSIGAGVGSMLAIKPVITAQDGRVVLVGKARGSKNGRNLLTEQVAAAGGIDFTLPALVGFSGLSDALLGKYIRDSMDLWKDHVEEVPVCTMGAAVGTHAGPGAIVLGFFGRGAAGA